MKFFIPLLLVFLFKQAFPQIENDQLGISLAPRFMPSSTSGITPINFEKVSSKNQWTLGIKNIWSQEDINSVSLRWAHQKKIWSCALDACYLSHPYWKNTSFAANEQIALGEHTVLCARISAQHQKWNQEWAPWEWSGGLGTAFVSERWGIQCQSNWQPTWNNGRIENNNFIFISAQLQLAHQVRLVASTQWKESDHYLSQLALQWQNEKRWQFTAGTAWPNWMWTMGLAWRIDNWSNGIWMNQNAWTRPSLEYKMRYEK